MTDLFQISHLSRLGRWLFFCFGFCWLPLFLLNLGLDEARVRREENQSQLVADRIMRLLEKIRNQAAEEKFYCAGLTQLASKVADISLGTPAGLLTAGPILKDVQGRFPGLFDFYVTSPAGELIPTLSSPVASKLVLKRMHEALWEYLQTGKSDKLLAGRKTFEVFLGEASDVDKLGKIATQEKVIYTSIGGHHSYFFFQFLPDHSCFMAHINTGALPPICPWRSF